MFTDLSMSVKTWRFLQLEKDLHSPNWKMLEHIGMMCSKLGSRLRSSQSSLMR